MSQAGPSRPRRTSQSSQITLDDPSPSTHYDRRNTTPGTSVFDADTYDDDPDDLPGYSTPAPSGPSRHEEERDERRNSQERLLRESRDPGGSRGRGEGDKAGGRARGSRTSSRSRERHERGSELDVEERLRMDDGIQGMAQRQAAWWKSTIITGIFVCGWYGSATLLSIYNKWMFSPQYYNFPFPLFVTACHMCVQFTLAALVRLVFREKYRPVERPTRKDYVAKIFPTAFSTAGDIGLSNLSLRTITLSLYTMCKSSALIFVLLFAFLFRLERFSIHLIGVITLITAGVFLMVFDTTSVNIPGIVMVFSASALSGLRWALTETLMKKKSMGLSNPFATIYWLAPLMFLTLIPVSLGVEGLGNVFGNGHFDGSSAFFTVLVIIFPGAIAFAMVSTEYFIIHRAGILPLSVAGVFKEVTTISISAWVFGDQLTNLNIVGVAIAVCGIALYAYHKYTKAMSSSPDEDSPLVLPAPTDQYTLTSSHEPDVASRSMTSPGTLPMTKLPSRNNSYPFNSTDTDTASERAGTAGHKRMADFEGWNDNDDWTEADDDEDEDDDEEILNRRKERLRETGRPDGSRWWDATWGKWWDKTM